MSINTEINRIKTAVADAYTAVSEQDSAAVGAEQNIAGLANTIRAIAPAVFIPSVSDDGEISWTNNRGLENPGAVTIKGAQGEDGEQGAPTIFLYSPVALDSLSYKGSALYEYYDDLGIISDVNSIFKDVVKQLSIGLIMDLNGKVYIIDTMNSTNIQNFAVFYVCSIKGPTGEQGPAGKDGATGPAGKDGATGETGPAGKDGINGKDGQDGYTPIKGTDYFTADDKQELLTELLTNVYKKTEVYAKSETMSTSQINSAISTAIASADHMKRKKLSGLSDLANEIGQVGAENYIYMVPSSNQLSEDHYDEYMIIDGKAEKVGDWEVDLSDYAKKTDLNSYVTNTALTTTLAPYAKSSEIPDLDGYATEDFVTGKGYATEAFVNNKGYQTSTQVNTAITNKLNGYATESFVTGKGYATQAYVDSKIHFTTSESDVPDWAPGDIWLVPVES